MKDSTKRTIKEVVVGCVLGVAVSAFILWLLYLSGDQQVRRTFDDCPTVTVDHIVSAEYRTVTVALTDGTTSDVNQPIPAVRAGSKFTLCRSTSND